MPLAAGAGGPDAGSQPAPKADASASDRASRLIGPPSPRYQPEPALLVEVAVVVAAGFALDVGADDALALLSGFAAV